MASVSTTDGQDDFSALEAGIVDVNTEIESLKAAENPGAFQKLSTNIRGKVAALTMAGAALFGAANVEPVPQVEAADRVVAAATPNTANSAEEERKLELIRKLQKMRHDYAVAIDDSRATWANIIVAGHEQVFARHWEAERKFTHLHAKKYPDQFGFDDWTSRGKEHQDDNSRTYIFCEENNNQDGVGNSPLWYVVTTNGSRVNKYNPYGVIAASELKPTESLDKLIQRLDTGFKWKEPKSPVVMK